MMRNALYVGTILLGVSGCVKDPNEEPYTPSSTKLENLAFSSGELNPPFDPAIKSYSISSINSLSRISITAKRYVDQASVKVNSTTISGESASLIFEKGKDILVTVKFRDSSEVYKISWIPPDFPHYKIDRSSSTSKGDVYFAKFNSPLSSCYAVIIDSDGIPVFYRKILTNSLGDFKKHTIANAKARYSYIKRDTGIPQVLGGFQGSRVILDENFNEIETIESLKVSGSPASPENHDFILIDDHHYIVTSYVLRRGVDLSAYGGNKSVDLVETLIQEVKNGSIILEWRSSDFPEFLNNADDLYKVKYTGAGPVDYFHFNSIFIDPTDGNLILSARHMNQVYKINRATGKIIWRLGGKSDEFNLAPQLMLSHQHHVTRLENGNLLIFDNGNTRNPQITRVLEVQINENQKTAVLVWQYQEADRFSSFMGSAQRLPNGNTLIGWGSSEGTSQPDRSDISEVTPQGKVVFDLSFKNEPSNQVTYRAFRFE